MTSPSESYLNSGFHNDEVGTPKLSNKLPPLELDTPRKPKNKSKSPRLTRQEIVEQQEAPESVNSNGITSPKRQKKKRNKNRPTSAESGKSNNPVLPLEEDKNSSAAHLKSGAASNLTDDVQSVRPKDPNRKLKVSADIEHENSSLAVPKVSSIPRTHSASALQELGEDVFNSERSKDPKRLQRPVLRSRSSSSLHTFDLGKNDDADTIDVVSTTISTGNTKVPHSILKTPSIEGDHVIDMFRAGSRPNSATSSKPSVRIDDHVTYSSELGSTAALTQNSSRPSSAKKSRPSSATKNPPRLKVQETHRFRLSSKLNKTTQRKVNPHTKTSVFTLVFCGVFAGAAALYFSLRSKKALKEGKHSIISNKPYPQKS